MGTMLENAVETCDPLEADTDDVALSTSWARSTPKVTALYAAILLS